MVCYLGEFPLLPEYKSLKATEVGKKRQSWAGLGCWGKGWDPAEVQGR